MSEKITVDQLMRKISGMSKEIDSAITKSLRVAAVRVHSTAVQKFGVYQPGIGSFEGWALLTLETLHRKMDLAGGGPDPLVGHYAGSSRNSVYPVSLRQSLAIHVERLRGTVGTNDPLGEYHEYGTRHIPPRPFLRPALYQNADWIEKSMSEAIGMGMVRWFR